MSDEDGGRGWRHFAIGTMTLFFTALFIFAALADQFLSRFMPVFVGLMLIALLFYTLIVGTLRLIQRLRRRTPAPPISPRSESEAP